MKVGWGGMRYLVSMSDTTIATYSRLSKRTSIRRPSISTPFRRSTSIRKISTVPGSAHQKLPSHRLLATRASDL